MPPKKNTKDLLVPDKGIKEKLPRKRTLKEKIEKPNSKTPRVIKAKVPVKNIFPVAVQKQNAPKRNKKDSPPLELSPAAQRKIDLANEVALAQLSKSNTEIRTSPEVVKKKVLKKIQKPNSKPVAKPAEKAVVRSRGQQKKSKGVETPVQEVETTPSEGSVVLPKKKKVPAEKTILPKKLIKKSESPKPEVQATSKRKADSTSEPAIAKRKYVRRTRACRAERADGPPPAPPPPPPPAPAPPAAPRDLESPSILDATAKTVRVNMVKLDAPPPAPPPPPPPPAPASSAGSSDCPSWTRDLSSSSTTTCLTVRSKDRVLIDQRVPVLKLSHVDNEWKNVSANNVDESDSSDSSSEDSSSSSSSSSGGEEPPGGARRPDLSSPSATPATPASPATPATPDRDDSLDVPTGVTGDDDWEYAYKKLTASLNKLDLEAIEWIGYENRDLDIDLSRNKIFRLLELERNLLSDCESLIDHLTSGERGGAAGAGGEGEAGAGTYRSEDDGTFTTARGADVMFGQTRAPPDDPLRDPPTPAPAPDDPYGPDAPSPGRDYDPFAAPEDVLSLHPEESFAGLESSRVAAPDDDDEYVPRALAPAAPAPRRHVYVPSKIAPDGHARRTVCEKQNADSTSISKEAGDADAATFRRPERPPPAAAGRARPSPDPSADSPPAPRPAGPSAVFPGLCFYHVGARCVKPHCPYAHRRPDAAEVGARLARLSDARFAEECHAVRAWPALRRRYLAPYAAHAASRRLAGPLLELVLDAARDPGADGAARVEAAERALLLLNDEGPAAGGGGRAAAALRAAVGGGERLADVLLRTLGATPNFARFQSAFVRLARFVVGEGGRFDATVAAQILERVCILPAERALGEAAVLVLRHTDPALLESELAARLAERVAPVDLALYGELCGLRKRAELDRAAPAAAPAPPPPPPPAPAPSAEREERYTSPDTTKIDNSNKPSEEPPEQTVRMVRPSIFSQMFPDVQLSPPPPPPHSPHPPRPHKYRAWGYRRARVARGGPYPPRYTRMPPPPPPPPPAPPRGRRRSSERAMYGASPPKYRRLLRPPGPEYY